MVIMSKLKKEDALRSTFRVFVKSLADEAKTFDITSATKRHKAPVADMDEFAPPFSNQARDVLGGKKSTKKPPFRNTRQDNTRDAERVVEKRGTEVSTQYP